MKDLIERQAAIDVLHGYFDGMLETDTVCPQDLYNLFEIIPSAQPEIIRCKDCKYFEYDHVETVNRIPLIIAHEICMRWSNGVKTSEDGYCFLAERRIDE